jgi:hypothetical protein
MATKRTSYVVTVRAEPGIDEVRALRAWLKIGLRTFRLKCLDITSSKENVMDMRNYASKKIKPDHVRDGPMQTRIINVLEDDRYNRPKLELENGCEFTLNDGNMRELMKAWGFDSNDWLGLDIEFYFGTWKDWRSDPPEEKETVRVRAISPRKGAPAPNGGTPPPRKPLPPTKAAAPVKKDLDDEIPWR